ncbi:MAG TPA: hypothetical protein VIM53_01730 [Candidatus Saccharimonadales bacterium]
MSATLTTDRVYKRQLPPPNTERVVTRHDGEYSLVDVHHSTVITKWHHRGALALNGEVAELRRLSGIPDGQLPQPHLYSDTAGCGVQIQTGKILYGCGVSIDMPENTLKAGRAIYNGSTKALEKRCHALVLGVSLLGATSLEVGNGAGEAYAQDAFPLGQTVEKPHGGEFAVELGNLSLSCVSEAGVTYGDETVGGTEPELRLLVHRTEEVLYIGAAVCGEGDGVAVPPHHELRIVSSMVLGDPSASLR